MGIDPVRPGIAYRTDKDLRSLFTTFPRADDGSKAEFPNLLADTIQPTIDLGEASNVTTPALAAERINVSVAAPGQQTPFITVPVTERWILWRAVVIHGDVGINQALTIFLAQPGLGWGGAAIAIKTTEVVPVARHVVAERPHIMQPAAVVVAAMDQVPAAGALNLDVVITRFSLDAILPTQVTMGF